MSLLAKLKAGTANTRRVKFPGTEEDAVLLRVLTEAEIQSATFDAEAVFREAGISYAPQTMEIFERERTVQMLYRAMRSPEKPEAGFSDSVTELKRLLTRDEIDVLVDEYLALERECSPRAEDMTEAHFNALLAEVKKSPAIASNFSSIALLRRLVIVLAGAGQTEQTSPPDSGSTSS